jgi:N-carbamoyl-L-amino-acid hydrolase
MRAARVTIDGARLWQRLEQMARVGATPGGGVNRQALSTEDAEAKDLLITWSKARGYAVATDRIGNLFIRRAGRSPHLPPVLTGSHLDSQPSGGRYDGTYGVLAGLEVLESLDDCRIETERTIELAVWMNEEGSRFVPTTMGSAVFSGALPLSTALATRDASGTSVGEALASVRGGLPADLSEREPRFPIAAYVEAHIEQGPVLEQHGARIGAVSGIQGLRWFEVEIRGRAAHAGTTPRADRQDALMAALDLLSDLRRLLDDGDDDRVRFTVGRMTISPGSPNTVPDKLTFTIDLRHPDRGALNDLAISIRDACRRPARAGCAVDLREILDSPPVAFDPRIVESIRLATAARGYSSFDLVSGATHDAKYLAGLCPTGMIFIPCRDGISHHESEAIEPDDANAGAQILADVVLELACVVD